MFRATSSRRGGPSTSSHRHAPCPTTVAGSGGVTEPAGIHDQLDMEARA